MVSVLLLVSLLPGCQRGTGGIAQNTTDGGQSQGMTNSTGTDGTAIGEEMDHVYDGLFEGDGAGVTVECISGTAGCYTIDGNVLTFTGVQEDSVYAISGQLKGNIVIDTGDDHKFELELRGLSLICDSTEPISVLSGDKVALTAKNGYENFIYDTRETVADGDETQHSAAVYSKVDLKIGGKGKLTLISENNNGIHTKDDLEVKNLTLTVSCVDNALKGNDSVEITGGELILIATQGDGIKTSNTDISSKGNQRGTVRIAGSVITIYAACDGIDAAYDALIEEDSTVLNIYTDKYSSYSEEVTALDEDSYYIRFTSNAYYYSVKYYNSDEDYRWVDASYHSSVSGGRTGYYYYSFERLSDYEKMQFFIYASADQQGQEEECLVKSDYLECNRDYDTFALTQRGNSLSYQWTNYTTNLSGGMGGFGGMGGMNEGNSEKGDHSTKGIKAGNCITVNAGVINIKSYDDCLHANSETALENGETALGDVVINGGSITAYSNDDGVHADGVLTINGGNISVTHSYEGLEGTRVVISGGTVAVAASDDGINGTATSGTAIAINGGRIYVNCSGDGMDSNSRSSYQGIVFSGGKTVIICSSSNNSAIDTEAGYCYNGGSVVAIMPSRGMTSEAIHCRNFSSVAAKTTLNLTKDSYLTVSADGNTAVTVEMPVSLSATVIYLGDKDAKITTENTVSASFDSNGVYWN